MDKTVRLKKVNGSRKDEEDTQSMPAVRPPGDGAARGRRGYVRELDPLPEASRRGPGGKPPFWTRARKRKALLAGGFIVALLIGFFCAGYEQSRADEEAARARIQQEQAASQAKDAAALNAKKADLEQKKQELEQKKQELARQAARAEGRNEQITDEKKSTLGKLVDKVTGREKQQQASQAANTAEKAAADRAAQQVDEALTQAQQMLDDVNAQLQDSNKLQAAADSMRAGAQDTYENHRDIIDSVTSYIANGARTVMSRFLPH